MRYQDITDWPAHFAACEAQVPNLTPGVEKRVVWATAPGEKTPLSVLYLHGFSATSEEIRPVPDLVAQALGANLIFTRLTGHGRDGVAMAEATPEAWMNDVTEALAASRDLGQQVIVIATSTGGTLAALAALDTELSKSIKGIAFVSPNFELSTKAARIFDLPFARRWLPWIIGKTRRFVPRNAGHETYWSTTYPTIALFPMTQSMRRLRGIDKSRAKNPALFLYSPLDRVISAPALERAAREWGGPVTLRPQDLPPGCDPNNHVIAGDIMSPPMTKPATEIIVEWIKTL